MLWVFQIDLRAMDNKRKMLLKDSNWTWFLSELPSNIALNVPHLYSKTPNRESKEIEFCLSFRFMSSRLADSIHIIHLSTSFVNLACLESIPATRGSKWTTTSNHLSWNRWVSLRWGRFTLGIWIILPPIIMEVESLESCTILKETIVLEGPPFSTEPWLCE